jgi:hypothetical protein
MEQVFMNRCHLQYLAIAYSELGELDDARRCIDDAIETMERSKEKWCVLLSFAVSEFVDGGDRRPRRARDVVGLRQSEF